MTDDILERPVDPVEAGFDPVGLERLDAHLRSYVDGGVFPGWQLVVSRHGRVAHHVSYGRRDDDGTPVGTDTTWRLFSMTKPIVSVAAMALVERGALDVDEPIATWLPEFAAPRVAGAEPGTDDRPAREPIRVRHLLTHTAGFGMGMGDHPVDRLYREVGVSPGSTKGMAADLEEWVGRLAALPLKYEPGTAWEYGNATDVLGRVLEVAGGAPLDRLVATLVTEPLGMSGTAFRLDDRSTLGDLYTKDEGGFSRAQGSFPPDGAHWLSAGGGMVGPAADYRRFTQMLLDGGDGPAGRVLRADTVATMGRNQLPGGATVGDLGTGGFSETRGADTGFGYGFAVTLTRAAGPDYHEAGEMAWGGAASTAFWVDRANDLAVEFYAQVLPSPAFSVREEIRALVYRALGW